MTLPSGVYVAWGKLKRDGEQVQTHPLVDHMLDVAACFAELTQCCAIHRALGCAAKRVLDEVDLARLAVLVFLHDIGKANAGFQSRRWDEGGTPSSWPRTPYGHGPEGWALVTGGIGPIAEGILSGLPLADFASWGDEEFSTLLQASISHHGRPVKATPLKQTAVIWRPVVTGDGTLLYDPASTVVAMGQALRSAFPKAFNSAGRRLPATPAFVHLFAGLVQLSDWLGSDKREGFFPYTAPGENRLLTVSERARHAVHAIGLSVTGWRDVLQGASPQFSHVFGVPAPRPMQTAIAGQELGQLVVLEAETGSGKTEAALWRFASLFASGAVDSLYFALPTRVSASQLYERVRNFASRLWPHGAPVVVRALPGYEAADGATKVPHLPAFEVLWADQPADLVAHRRWAAESPKRYLAATVAVGTIDQILFGALRVRHAHLRHALLSRSLLVVDEVHASDAYMTTLLEQLLKAHVAAGGHALLLSATLGATARARYLHTGRPGHPLVSRLAHARAVAYPAISHQILGGSSVHPAGGNPQHKHLHWATLDIIDAPEAVATLAVKAARAGAKVLVVRNTVPNAVKTLLAIEAQLAANEMALVFTLSGMPTLHHSRFSRLDRPLLDAEVASRFGKYRAFTGGCILVGTQTLEQSLDIDADLLITDLCPMDVLLQRVGRLHRHTRPIEERPPGYQIARAWILVPAGGDLSALLVRAKNGLGRMRDGGGVYPDLRILEATRQLVEAQPSRRIPEENRVLVEEATHPEALHACAARLGEPWQQHGQLIDGDASARRIFAGLQAIDYEQDFDSQGFPDEEQKVATRLGAADRTVLFAPQPGPFGMPVSELALRFHQLPKDLAADAQACAIAALPDEPGFTFNFGTARYRYSRLGLERLAEQAT